MGIRLAIYAVDLSRLDKFLASTLVEVFRVYIKRGKDPGQRLLIVSDETDDTFTAVPQGEIRGTVRTASGRNQKVIAEHQLDEVPLLQRTVRDYINHTSNYNTRWILQAFSNCEGIDFIQRIMDGQRRWWVGSVLQSAKAILPSNEYGELVYLFRKLLRGMNCGYPIPKDDVGVNVKGLPFSLKDNPDFRTGRWSEDETFTALDLLSKLLTLSPSFTPPPGPVGIAPDPSEWHVWVHAAVASILDVWDLDYFERNVLSFIG